MWFTDKFCDNCKNQNPDPEGGKNCDILCRTLVYDIKDDEYPEEWTYDKDDDPICTAHKPWNWDELGDPDDPENKNYVMPFNPNQMTMFEGDN